MVRVRRSLVQKLLRAADSPFFELPKGWHVLSRYRTSELFLKHRSQPDVRYNDSTLYRTLLKRYPEVKLQPLRINSSQPSLASAFVGQQRHLIEQQLQQQQAQQQQQQPGVAPPHSRAELLETTFQQVASREGIKQQLLAAGSETSAGGYIELLQEQEEAVLQQALKKLGTQEALLQKK